jgi:hypothetical protein
MRTLPQEAGHLEMKRTHEIMMRSRRIFNVFILGMHIFLGAGATVAITSGDAWAAGPLRIGSTNPHYFTEAGGKAVYLVGTSVHGTFQPNTFGNPNYTAYLNSMVSYGHNLQRMRIWENGWIPGTAWVAVPMIYKRTGPGLATDGKPKFDLNQFDETFFTTLRSRIVESRDKGIYVMLMFFHGYSTRNDGRDFWSGHPYYKDNNINGINGDPNGDGQGMEIHTMQIPAITKRQEAYIRKILDTLNDLDNVFYETGNELSASPQFQRHIVNFVKSQEAAKPKQHVVGISAYFKPEVAASWEPISTSIASPADWVAPSWADSGASFSNPAVDSRRIIFFDTDHIAGWGLSPEMVQWPWRAFMRGYNLIFMDVPEEPTRYGRDPDRVEMVRRRLGQTSNYARKMNLMATRPDNALASTGYCLASPGSEYLAYQPASGAFNVKLAAGTYSVEWFNPATGAATPGRSVTAAAGRRRFQPPFSGEAVLYLKRGR